MSKPEVERFVADLKTDATLQAAVKGSAVDTASLVAIAKARGYDFDIEDVLGHLRAHKYGLTEQELNAVAGGVFGMGGMGGLGGGFTKT